jgi:hypothetical protein
VTFTAKGSGGTGSYEYQFWLLSPGGSWTSTRAYSSTPTWAWDTTGLATGTYQINVWAKSAESAPTAGYDTYTIINYTLNALAPSTAVTLTPNVTSPQSVASTVTFTATGSGGTGAYEYQFWVLAPGGSWTSKRAYSSTPTWSWDTTGLAAGTYQINVWAKTAGSGPSAGYDTYKVVNFTLN